MLTAWRSMLLGEERRLLPVVRFRHGLATGLEHFPWNTLPGQRGQELRCEGTVHHAGKLACIVSISFMLKSRITPTLILPIGVKTSEFDTSR
jgi:hypothetical protein